MKVGEQKQRLLQWYDQFARRLPWRAEKGEAVDPYRVLVSEIMLQQTRVEVVVPRYREFLTLFGTVEALAEATSEEVRAAWSGLGYYRRAERLHESARAIQERGCFPKTAQTLRLLPGVGEYTAAAVASIAFGEVVPVLDGNVVRVVSRLLAIEGNPRRSAIRRKLVAGAFRLVASARAGDSNQAMMELGATVCTKARPNCEQCPLRRGCRALRQGRPTDYPTVVSARLRKKRTWVQIIVLRTGKEGSAELLLQRRGSELPLLPRVWLPPEGSPEETCPEEAMKDPQEVAGGSLFGAELGRFHHSITDTDYQVVLLRGRVPAAAGVEEAEATEGRSARWRWVPLSSFDNCGRWQGKGPLPTSSMLAKAVLALRKATAGP